MTTNRETARDYLVSLLTAACVGTGKPAQAIYGYLKGDLEGQSPVIVVASAGAEMEKRAVTSKQKNGFYYTIYTFTLYAQDGTAWGEDDVEDTVDLLEKTIRETIAGNLSNDYWAFIEIEGRSTISSVMIAGEEYRMESIPVRCEKYDD
jgi:hypothetical protein